MEAIKCWIGRCCPRTNRVGCEIGETQEASFGEEDPADIGTQFTGLFVWSQQGFGVRSQQSRQAGSRDLERACRRHPEELPSCADDGIVEGGRPAGTGGFEIDTVFYPEENYDWQWNVRGNLEGRDRKTGEHKFSWQPHGSQFTILEKVPPERLAIRIKQPPALDREEVLRALDFNEEWIQVVP